MKHLGLKLAALAIASMSAAAAQAGTYTAYSSGGHFTLTLDDSLMSYSGVTFNSASGEAILSTGFEVNAASDGNPMMYSHNPYGFSSGSEVAPVLVTITADAGYVVTGVTETFKGSVSGFAKNADSAAAAVLQYDSSWKSSGNGGSTFEGNGPLLLALLNKIGPDASVVNQTYSGTLSTSFAGLAGQTVVLSDAYLNLLAAVRGGRAQSGLTVDNYILNVQTSPVPEPQTLALVLAGVGVVGLRMKRRNQA